MSTSKECTQKATTDAYEILSSDGDDDNASISYSPEVTLAACNEHSNSYNYSYLGDCLVSFLICCRKHENAKALGRFFKRMHSVSTPKKETLTKENLCSPSQTQTPRSKVRPTSSPPLHRMRGKTATQTHEDHTD